MGFFSCLTGSKKLKNARRNMLVNDSGNPSSNRFLPGDSSVNNRAIIPTGARGKNNGAITFSFRELAFATQHFRPSNMIGEGGFGKVFRGRLESGQVVAIKMLNHAGVQGSKEFLVEILMLIMLRHHNLVSLIGFCTDGDEKLLVYEYLAQGSLERHLFGHPVEMGPLDWNTRIKIALGAAKGLEYLHEVANPPVIYRDLKSANILLDNEFNPKLSDFGLAKLAPVGENTHVSTRVMGTYGYCAPDYAMSGKLTMKSDIYSFGVVLLELITGRRAYDSSKDAGEQNLISWARPFLSDRRMFIRLADPLLRGCFHLRPFYQLIVITTMCLQEASEHRPIISDVVVALEHVASQPYIEVDERVGSPSILSSPSPCGNKRVR